MDMQPKSFWERPEGTTGLGFIAILVFAGLFTMYKFGDVLVSILQNTLHAAFLGGTIMAIVALAMNERFRLICTNAFKLVMRHFTSWFITIDPIGILENHIDEMDSQITKIKEHTNSLSGQKRKMKNRIESKTNEMEKHLKLASKAKDSGNQTAATLNARSAGRAKDVVDNLQKTYDKIERLYKVLLNMLDKVKFLRDDTDNLVENKKYEYDSIKAAHKAMSGAQRLLQGNDSQMALFEMTMEHIADDIGMKVGEMESFMEDSEAFMTNVDLETGILDETGLQLLDKFEKGESLLDKPVEIPTELLNNTEFSKVENTTKNVNNQLKSYFN